MEQTAKVTLDQQIDKYLIDVKDALTKAIGAEKTDKIFTDAAAYKIEWPVPEQEICNCNGASGSPFCAGTCFKTVLNNADISGPHCSPGAPSSREDQPLIPDA